MKDNRITVDEPLISTDVDNLIRTIAEKKSISLNDLRQECQVSKRNIDKWVAVLEEEGYISVQYGLGGTTIHWKGVETNDDYGTYEREEPPPVPEEVMEAVEEEAPSEEPKEINEEFTTETPLEEEEIEEVNPEELLSQYVEKRRDGSKSPAVHDLKSSILSSLDDEEVDEAIAKIEEPEPEEELSEEEPQTELLDNSDKEEEPEEIVPDTALDSPDDSGDDEPLVIKEPEVRPTRGMVMSDVRELMDSYMAEINTEKAKIAELKKEKEALYRDKISILEGRMQADLVTFTEKILEKQSQLADLKEHVLELPDKVDEVESLHRNMEELKKEGRAALKRTKQKSEEYVQNIEASRELIQERIGELESSMEEQAEKLEELEGLSSSLDDRSNELRTTLEEARVKVDELNQAMAGVMNDLRQVEEARNGIVSIKDEIRETVASHGDELRSLEEELEGISRTEHWVQEYVRDYEEKIDDIAQYVERSEDELAELKESAESLYLKKYLGELETLTDAYDTELSDAFAREKNIDEDVSRSKARITELVKESQEMIKKIRGDVSEAREFDDVFAKVKKKTTKVKATVAEKSTEREKLVEESSKARKSKPTGKPKLKAKAKTKKKSRKTKKK